MTLYLERDVERRARCSRWVVRDDGGAPVGIVAEEWRSDPSSTYYAQHNPADQPFQVLWTSEGHATPQDALGALADHLARSR